MLRIDQRGAHVDFAAGEILMLWRKSEPDGTIEMELLHSKDYTDGDVKTDALRVVLRFGKARGVDGLVSGLKMIGREFRLGDRPTWARVLGVQEADELVVAEKAHRHLLNECHPSKASTDNQREFFQRRASRLNWAVTEARRAHAARDRKRLADASEGAGDGTASS